MTFSCRARRNITASFVPGRSAHVSDGTLWFDVTPQYNLFPSLQLGPTMSATSRTLLRR